MKSLKIAFGILLCITILSVSASVVCAVIAGNTAESFRDYRSSVITVLSSLHAQLNRSQEAFADALTYMDGAQNQDGATEPAIKPLPETETQETVSEQQSSTAQGSQDSQTEPETTQPVTLYTVRRVDGCIGVFDADGQLIRTINVSVATLPKADREQLAVGIVLTSEEELAALIEDYSG